MFLNVAYLYPRLMQDFEHTTLSHLFPLFLLTSLESSSIQTILEISSARSTNLRPSLYTLLVMYEETPLHSFSPPSSHCAGKMMKVL